MRTAIACLSLLFCFSASAQQDTTRTLAAFADLRAASVSDLTKTVIVMSGTNFNDGFGGIFHWNALDATAEDGTNIIRSVRTTSGRWDRVTLFVVTAGSSLAPNTPPINIITTNSITGGGRTTNDVGPIKLVGDASAPGANKMYRTDGAGARGWYDFPTGGGLGDVVSTANNLFSGSNTNNGSTDFVGPLRRTAFHGVTNLNWSTMNSADYSASTDFAIQFSGSYENDQLMEYWVTNTAVTNISVFVPESWSVAIAGYTTNVEISASSVAILRWKYDGQLFKLSAETKNDSTLLALSTSGYFYAEVQTIDNAATTITNLVLRAGHEARVTAWFLGGTKTNTGTAQIEKTGVFRNDGGTVSLVGTFTNSFIRSADASAWDADLTTDGTNIVVNVTGDALNPVNWAVQGFAMVLTNGPTLCSRERDSRTNGPTQNAVNTDSYYWRASKFTAQGDYRICHAALKLSRLGSPSGSVTAMIYSHNSGADKPNALIGSASSSVLKASIGTTSAYVDFNDLSATLVTGTTYWIVLKSQVTDDGSNNILWDAIFTGTGTHGTEASNDDGANWVNDYDQGAYMFILYSN